MSIQFNKVTWYSVALAIIVFIGAIFLGWYIYGQFQEVASIKKSSEKSVKVVPTNGNVALVVGDSAEFDGLKISFEGVIADNRCPVGVTCIQVGNVTARINLSAGNKSEVVDLVSDKVLYRFSNYAVSVLQAGPIRRSGEDIDPANYIVIFHLDNLLTS